MNKFIRDVECGNQHYAIWFILKQWRVTKKCNVDLKVECFGKANVGTAVRRGIVGVSQVDRVTALQKPLVAS